MKDENVCGSRGIAPLLLTSALDSGERRLHPVAALNPYKSPRYPLNWSQGGPQRLRGRCCSTDILAPTVRPVVRRYAD
jgi:hypothetical protein